MKPRILIVDDDEAITQQLFWTLSDEFDVVMANDMQTAIRRVMFYKPDISILDLQLPPAVDSPTVGLRLLEYIKGHLPESRVLIMSSMDDAEIQKACYASGADDFFDKSTEFEKIRDVPAEWLIGPYISAYVKVHRRSKEARRQAGLLLRPFEEHLRMAALGQVSEIADGEFPHEPRGCVAQAWSVGELLRAAVEDVYEMPLSARAEAILTRS